MDLVEVYSEMSETWNEIDVPVGSLSSPVELGGEIEPGTFSVEYQPGKTFSDWDLNGAVLNSGGIPSAPYVNHPAGIFDDWRSFVANAAAGQPTVKIRWRTPILPYNADDHAALALANCISQASVDVQPYLQWYLFLSEAPTVQIGRVKEWNYWGTLELTNKTSILDGTLRVANAKAMQHYNGQPASTKQLLGQNITAIVPHDQCDVFTMAGVEIDGNYANNQEWVGGPNEAAVVLELRDTPSWCGISRSNHGGRRSDDDQAAALSNCDIHDVGSTCLLGGNNWEVNNLRTANSLGNKHFYFTAGQFSNLLMQGYSRGEYARFTDARIVNLQASKLAINPLLVDGSAMIACNTNQVSTMQDVDVLQRIRTSIDIQNWMIDCRDHQPNFLFSTTGHGVRISGGRVITKPGDSVDVFSGWGNISVNNDNVRAFSASDVTIQVNGDTDGHKVLSQWGLGGNDGINGADLSFNRISTVGSSFGNYYGNTSDPAFTFMLKTNTGTGKYRNRDIYLRVADCHLDGMAFILRMDVQNPVNGYARVFFDRCVFGNRSNAPVVSPTNTGRLTGITGQSDRYKIHWRDCTFVQWDGGKSSGNHEILDALSTFERCFSVPGVQATGVIDWTNPTPYDGT